MKCFKGKHFKRSPTWEKESFLKTISNEKESNTYRFINILNNSYNCHD